MEADLKVFDPLVSSLAHSLREAHLKVACAESCTGGLISAACTSIPGSSDWFERGFVTYSNEAKVEMLGVDPATLARCGAVSEEVARAMAEGALTRSHADISAAVTGIAGPGGATPGKPVGAVWLAISRRMPSSKSCVTQSQLLQLQGDRASIREQTVERSLLALIAQLEAGAEASAGNCNGNTRFGPFRRRRMGAVVAAAARGDAVGASRAKSFFDATSYDRRGARRQIRCRAPWNIFRS